MPDHIPSTLFRKLSAGHTCIGIGSMFADAGLLEVIAGKPWDFIWIDAQHGQYSYDSTLAAVRTCRGLNIDVLLRVPGSEYGVVGPFADLAPAAVMVPMINTAEEAAEIVANLKFPTLGKRSYGGRRAIDLHGRQYYRDSQPILIAQIETQQAADNAQLIAAVEGIDMLFFGADDMRVQMGLPLDTPLHDHPQLVAAMNRIGDAAKAEGKWAGGIAASGPVIADAIDWGYRLLVGGADVMFVRQGANACYQRMTESINKTNSSVGATSIYGSND